MSHSIKKLEPDRIFYDTATYRGQSRELVWSEKGIGAHQLGKVQLNKGNSVGCLSYKKLGVIRSWISQTQKYPKFFPLSLFVISTYNSMTLENQTDEING